MDKFEFANENFNDIINQYIINNYNSFVSFNNPQNIIITENLDFKNNNVIATFNNVSKITLIRSHDFDDNTDKHYEIVISHNDVYNTNIKLKNAIDVNIYLNILQNSIYVTPLIKKQVGSK